MKGITKKQAGIIYKNIKNGNITVPKGFAKAMYDGVALSDFQLGKASTNIKDVSEKCFKAIDFICNGQIELAQAIIDGHEVTQVKVVDGIKTRIAEIFDFDYEEGDIVVEEVYNMEWVIA